MEHFVSITFPENKSQYEESIVEHMLESSQRGLVEDETDYEVGETEQGAWMVTLGLHEQLDEESSDDLAESLANNLFEMGFEDFDIYVSTDEDIPDEETYNGNDFFEEYGVIGYAGKLFEAEYQGQKVELNKPIRSSDGPKKFHVYVKDPKTGNVKKVNFGDPDMEIKKDDPEARKNFRARHNCDNPGPKTKARYWSCKKW